MVQTLLEAADRQLMADVSLKGVQILCSQRLQDWGFSEIGCLMRPCGVWEQLHNGTALPALCRRRPPHCQPNRPRVGVSNLTLFAPKKGISKLVRLLMLYVSSRGAHGVLPQCVQRSHLQYGVRLCRRPTIYGRLRFNEASYADR